MQNICHCTGTHQWPCSLFRKTETPKIEARLTQVIASDTYFYLLDKSLRSQILEMKKT